MSELYRPFRVQYRCQKDRAQGNASKRTDFFFKYKLRIIKYKNDFKNLNFWYKGGRPFSVSPKNFI